MRELNFPGKENTIALWNRRLEGQREGEKCWLCPAGNADYFLAHLDPVFFSFEVCRMQRFTEGQSSEFWDIRSHFWPGVLHSTRGFHSHVRGELDEKPLFFREKPKNCTLAARPV